MEAHMEIVLLQQQRRKEAHRKEVKTLLSVIHVLRAMC
jgi:hypothetical protein